MSILTTEEAKAVEESAKATGKIVDVFNDGGKFAGKIFGNLLIDSFGLVSDRLRFFRIEKAVLLKQKTEKRLKDKGVESVIAISPKLGISLIEAAVVEDNENLHTKWANMLSNALTPNFGMKITRNFVSILEDMNPLDVFILDNVCEQYLSSNNGNKKKISTLFFDQEKIISSLKIKPEECKISLRNLLRLGCIKPGIIVGSGLSLGGHHPSSYKDIELFNVTELGIALYKSIK